MTIELLITEKKGSIVDVRTAEEFLVGHIQGSKNIPLQQIRNRIEEVKSFISPLILCCASGNRSVQAQMYLTSEGIECFNGGSWLDIKNYQSKNNNQC